jgi:3-hydroxyisobutyrate dehydrogenase-like beta-hydroxyacid dehydrogenase
MKEAVGYLGLGIMGLPMVRNLLRAGYPVVVYNRTPEKARRVAAEGAHAAATPAEVARRAKVVLACLYDAAAVEAVVEGPGGLLEGVGPGHVLVDMTTNSPPVSQRLAARLAEKGAAMLDAPVSGGDLGAREASLSIMVGGDPEVFQRCLPLLQALGQRITLMGPRVGAGGYAKLANQILVAIHLTALGEALVFGAKAGLDLEKLGSALGGGFANSQVLQIKLPRILRGDFTPGARAAVQLKDLDYIAQSQEKLGLSLPLTQRVHGLYRQLVESGLGDLDHSGIIRLLEREAGIEARAKTAPA